MCALVVALLAWTLLVATPALPDSVMTQLPSLLRNFSSGLFLTAGVLRIAGWRLTGDWAVARSGIALLLLGTALPSTTMLKLLMHDGAVVEREAPEARLLVLVPILVLAFTGARHSKHLVQRTLATLAAVAAAIAAVVVLAAHSAPAGQHHLALWLAVESLMAAAWAALSVQAWHRRRFAGLAGPGWVVVGLALMALGDALKAWSVSDSSAVHGLSSGVQLIAATIAAATAAASLRTSVRTETGDNVTLTRALMATQGRLVDVRLEQAERLHDARSAVLGVVGASKLLARPLATGTVDLATLQGLVADELARLQRLLDVEATERSVTFDPAEALAAVIRAHRLEGAAIESRMTGGSGFGHPLATATVVDNLLCNARKHAPGARVLIATRTVDDELEIVVSDDGPGIPAAERSGVLLPGVRGSGARGAGSGLGLYSAARAMVAQSGSLRIEAGPEGGTTVILRLPAAIVARAVPTMAS